MIEIHAYVDFVTAAPMLLGELVRGDKLKFLALVRPLIEKVSARAFRRNQHVRRALAVRVAIKTRVLRNGAENSARTKLMPICQPQSYAFLVQVILGRMRHERID